MDHLLQYVLEGLILEFEGKRKISYRNIRRRNDQT